MFIYKIVVKSNNTLMWKMNIKIINFGDQYIYIYLLTFKVVIWISEKKRKQKKKERDKDQKIQV